MKRGHPRGFSPGTPGMNNNDILRGETTMKKLFAIMLALMLVLTMGSAGGDDD